jgi:predicted house-cleaning noncanonical NTP pyrophosphatase (MazG superfamily)
MTTYNKLVRDKIPEILDEKRKTFSYHIANKEEYTQKLREKLIEEVNEFLEEPSVGELADIQEVIFALLENMGETQSKLASIQGIKSASRGGFGMGYILEHVEDDITN